MSAPSTAVLRYGGAAAVVLGLVVLVSRLALAPVQGVHNAAECRSAYAKAQTRSDSNAVDFRSFPDPSGRHITRRCNEVLVGPSPAVLSMRKTPRG